jgi:hypothetical protein
LIKVLEQLKRHIGKRLWKLIRPAIDRRISERVSDDLNYLRQAINQLKIENRLLRGDAFTPPKGREAPVAGAPFLRYSNCQSEDFYHPRYLELSGLIHQAPILHRKQWEWIFILHHLFEAGVVKPGARGLVFGVGAESLPAVFAKLGAFITATDAPSEMEGADAWKDTAQHGANLEALLCPYILPNEKFREMVRYQPCDMNHIDPSLQGYDFNWSSCCFEHLGSIEAGLDFVVNSVEKTLRVGGVAVHTTEFNLSSNDDTVSKGSTVIFRQRDMEALITRLRERGHIVADFVLGPSDHLLDRHIDTPPYQEDMHLKLLLAKYITTSAGLVVKRGC